MSQPTHAYPPAPGQQPTGALDGGFGQQASQAFRPASGWQQGGAPIARPRAVEAPATPSVALVLLAVSAYLLAAQVLASAMSAGSLDAGLTLSLLATWAPTGVVLSTLFAVAGRHRLLAAVCAGLGLVVAIGFPLLSAGEVWAPALVAVSVAIAVVAAVLGVLAPAEGTGPLRIVAVALAAAATLLFYGLSIVTPVVALEGSLSAVVGVVGTTPIALLSVAAALVLCFAPDGRALAGWLVCGLAAALLILPIASLVVGQPPVPASVAVVVVRALLVAAAGVLLLRSARR
ncbi:MULTISPECIES: hypothetical protein [unclassified Agrococcus]|uniref:hypothetical protein n=1 Tax=unclassified Agrococcus TaxID=2615065 RepID=UPI0036212E3E